MFAQLYMAIDILITRVKRLHDRINSLRGDDWTYRTTLPLPSFFIEVHVSCQEIEIAWISVLVILILTLWTIFRRNFGNVPILWYCCSPFHYNQKCKWRDGPIKVMCPSGATCLPADCCFNELALWKSNSAYWSGTKQTSSLSHWKWICSHIDVAEKLLNWR